MMSTSLPIFPLSTKAMMPLSRSCDLITFFSANGSSRISRGITSACFLMYFGFTNLFAPMGLPSGCMLIFCCIKDSAADFLRLLIFYSIFSLTSDMKLKVLLIDF